MNNMSSFRKFVIAWFVLFGAISIFSIFILVIFLIYKVFGLIGASIYLGLIFITWLAWRIAVEDGYT